MAKTFRETLKAHLDAILNRDLDGLLANLPEDEVVLVMADGTLVRSVGEFAEAHRGWFASKTWTTDFEEVEEFESENLAVVTLLLDYQDLPEAAEPIRQRSYLTLVF